MKKRLTINLPETITAPARFEPLAVRGETYVVEPCPLSWEDVTVTKRPSGELVLELVPHGYIGVELARLTPQEPA